MIDFIILLAGIGLGCWCGYEYGYYWGRRDQFFEIYPKHGDAAHSQTKEKT